MADALKDSFERPAVERIAIMFERAVPGFESAAFVDDALDRVDPELGAFGPAGLTDRARLVARALDRHLPGDGRDKLRAIERSLGDPLDDGADLGGMDGFVHLPHVYLVDTIGHIDVTLALDVQEALTQRFTCEFSIRSFIESAPAETMPRLHSWTEHSSEHVRRLVSEGTRPRLPWAARLRSFQQDPAPVIELLDRLVGDGSEYVRRSVANNLNDISKDHPDLAVATASRWWSDDRDRRRLVRHGLRTLVKAGDPGALAVLGYRQDDSIGVRTSGVEPDPARIGAKIRVSATIHNNGSTPAPVLVDLVVGFVKADGSIRPKVFKGGEATIQAGADHVVTKTISLAQHSTRTHHPGPHTLAVLVNGRTIDAGRFDVLEA